MDIGRLLPWRWVERRQRAPVSGSGNYTDAIVAAILSVSTAGTKASPLTTAAVEACAALYASAFAAAEVRGAAGLAPPSVMAAMARDLIRHGATCWVPWAAMQPGARMRLLHVDSWDVFGGWDPDTWRYQISVPAPSGSARSRRLPAADVVHVRYAHDRNQPWLGIGPLSWASSTGQLLAIVEQVFSQESSGTRGYVLPIPAGGEDDEVEALKGDLRNLSGGTALVETSAGGWGTGTRDAPTSDWQPKRIGPNYPRPVVELRDHVQRAVALACGVPLGLIGGGDATGLRESWRQFLHGSVAPLARIVEEELSEKLERSVRVDFTELWAADVQGRARAFQSMTGGGMDAAQAARLAGLEE